MIQSDFPTRQPAPKIGSNGNWLEWDELTQAYVDTGVTAASVIDATLTVAGEAADAKTTGDRLRVLDELADEVTEELDWNLIRWDFTTKTVQGLTFTANADGSLTVNGTMNTANAKNGIKVLDSADIDHTAYYTVHREIVSEDAPGEGDAPLLRFGYGTAATSVTTINNNTSVVIPEDNSIYIYSAKRNTYYNQRYTFQVYKGAEPLPYAPPESVTAVDSKARYAADQAAKKTMLCAVEEGMTASQNYTTGDLLIIKDTLYRVTANIANGGVISLGTNVTVTTMAAEIAASGGGSGGSSITVDSALSSTSENPVQNKVIKAALDAKATATSVPVSGSVSNAGVLSFANSAGTQLFTVQLPLYAGGVD